MEKCKLNAVFYNEHSKLILFDDIESDKRVEGKIDINTSQRVIRLYDFPKKELTNKDKVNIIYSILEGSVLYSHSKLFGKLRTEDIENYTLLVNGYSINGDFLKIPYLGAPNKNSVAYDLIENTKHYDGEPEYIENMRKTIKTSFDRYIRKHGMEEIVIDIEYKDLFKGYKDVQNLAKILQAYFLSKMLFVNLRINNKFLNNQKEIVILPLFKR